eukprot:TRINITY_DN469_c0_g1_i2.p1 TRINITY_DN469_c0_g1~~TRINITY_DN469_c0_g1_i2.p1  ORF type:complete len:352 (+),score=50.28 TRINITY_DN469_c0_g1_i2:51-1106(+)
MYKLINLKKVFHLPKFSYPQQRTRTKTKKILGKPRVKFILTEAAELILPEKVKGYTNRDMKDFRDYIRDNFEIVGPMDAKVEALKVIKDFKDLKFTKDQAVRRAHGKRRRDLRQKKRLIRKGELRNRLWQEAEDAKEYRILRDMMRTEREKRGEPFVFKRFLRAYQDFHRKPYPYLSHDAAAFWPIAKKDMESNFKRGPIYITQRTTGEENYKTRFRYEVWEPFWYELRRKVRLTTMIKHHQDMIKEHQQRETLKEGRIQKALRKRQSHEERVAHWGKVIGDWFTENNKLKALKNEYRVMQEGILSKSRREFLLAMNQKVNLWTESPDECKYLRFQFGEGIKFPYRKSEYW